MTDTLFPLPPVERLLSDEQAAYLAGLIDGEGHIAAGRSRDRRKGGGGINYSPAIRIAMASPEPLQTVADWLGLKLKWVPRRDRLYSMCELDFPASIALRILVECMPHLVLKRRQAELALEIDKVRRDFVRRGRHTPVSIAVKLNRLTADLQAERRASYGVGGP